MEITNISKLKRDKMLDTIKVLKSNTMDDETLQNLSLIENELTKKKYGLIWEEHQEKVDEELLKNIPVFVEDASKKISKVEDENYNYLIEGDNLHSLYLLQKTHNKKIDMIYIDPPYNTGKKDFIYNDKFIDVEDGYRHSKWLSFMHRRLSIAKELLKDNGFIFISIDDNECSQLKLLCDSVFGEGNFISMLTIENNPKGRKNSNFVSVSNEYCLIYSKNKSISKFIENIPKNKADLSLDEDGNYVHNSGKRVLVGENKFNNIVDDLSSDKHYSVYYKKSTKEIEFKIEGELEKQDQYLIENGYTRYVSYFNGNFVYNTYTKTKLLELYNNKLLDFKENKIYEKNMSTTIRIKSIVSNKKYDAISNGELIKGYEIDVKTTSANQMLKEVLGTDKVEFDNPKNIGLIKLLVSLLENKDALILDFFAGSGTTGHAVMDLNKEDGGNRNFILCTNNENNICENVTYKRIENVINGYGSKEGIPSNLKYLKTNFVPRINDDENNIHFSLLDNVKNLIELEIGKEIDGNEICLFSDEESFDKFTADESLMKRCSTLFISADILITSKQYEMIEKFKINSNIIPEYYFENEIKELL